MKFGTDGIRGVANTQLTPELAMAVGRAAARVLGGPTIAVGRDPRRSVLDPDCRVHGADNLFVADGGFMPTGGSVPPTWTIYANALRVGDRIAAQL